MDLPHPAVCPASRWPARNYGECFARKCLNGPATFNTATHSTSTPHLQTTAPFGWWSYWREKQSSSAGSGPLPSSRSQAHCNASSPKRRGPPFLFLFFSSLTCNNKVFNFQIRKTIKPARKVCLPRCAGKRRRGKVRIKGVPIGLSWLTGCDAKHLFSFGNRLNCWTGESF